MSSPIQAEVFEVVSGGAGNPRVIAGTADPSAGGGVAASEGTHYLRYVAGAAEFWYKTGALDTDWVSIAAVGTLTHTTGVQSRGVGTAAVVGNAKGTGASDLQTDRTAVTQVASGANAFAAGRRNTASGTRSTALGDTNTASGSSSVALGSTCTASNTGAVAAGNATQATASGAAALGSSSVAGGATSFAAGNAAAANGANSCAIGDTCTASSAASMAAGSRASVARQGQFSRANGRFSLDGDSQYSLANLRRQTTDATVTELTLDGGAPAAGTRFILTDNTAYTIRILVTGRNAGAVQMAAYEFLFAMDRGVGVGTVRIVGAIVKTVIAEDDAAWDCNVVADAVNGSLQINVTGVAATTIRWSAAMWFNEVRTA